MGTKGTVSEQPTTIQIENHDELAHLIKKSDYYKGYVLGLPVRALCGYCWVPCRDPELFELCADCLAIQEGSQTSV